MKDQLLTVASNSFLTDFLEKKNRSVFSLNIEELISTVVNLYM